MTIVAIPEWTTQGVLPPIDVTQPTSPARSPYQVKLLDLVMRFATSPQRCEVLEGFLAFRSALHRLGIDRGFQWLDGSFLEDVETLEARPPQDIDVVTFLRSPATVAAAAADLVAVDHNQAKAQFKVDSYLVELDEISAEQVARLSAYWYSMWSHRRNQVWKGYLQVDLAPSDDAQAVAWLAQTKFAGAFS